MYGKDLEGFELFIYPLLPFHHRAMVRHYFKEDLFKFSGLSCLGLWSCELH